MRIDRGLLNWGVFLIALGGVPLAVQRGWAESGIAADLWRLWPLILIGIGLGLILRWTPLAWLGGALVAGTFGVVFGALLAGGNPCGDPGSDAVTSSQSGIAAGAAFEVDVSLNCGALDVTREEEARWSVTALHAEGETPAIAGDSDGLSVSQGADDDFVAFVPADGNDWSLVVPATQAVSLNASLNAVEADIDLGGGPLGAVNGSFNATSVTLDLADAVAEETASVNLSFNASSGTLSLPAGSVRASINANVSSVTLCVPASAALRIDLESTLSSDDFGDAGLEREGDGWQTAGYDDAAARVDVEIDSSLASLKLTRPEACP